MKPFDVKLFSLRQNDVVYALFKKTVKSHFNSAFVCVARIFRIRNTGFDLLAVACDVYYLIEKEAKQEAGSSQTQDKFQAYKRRHSSGHTNIPT